jgi:hypothetical protein
MFGPVCFFVSVLPSQKEILTMRRPPIEEEVNAMTLQVGLVATDGVVLASDRLLGQFEGSGFSQVRTSKFLGSDRVLCCYSGDTVAEHAAYHIVSSEEFPFPLEKEALRNALIAAGNKAWREIGMPAGLHEWAPTRKVLVALGGTIPFSQLWVVHVSPSTIANEVLDKVVAGDDRNTARHFLNNYVAWPPADMSHLVVIAAHTVLAGGRENPSGVGGLEVALVPKNGRPVFLPLDRERELERISAEIHAGIRGLVCQRFSVE